jgi:hypothetical protein
MPPDRAGFTVLGRFVPPESEFFCGFPPGNRAELPFPLRIILAIAHRTDARF